MMVLVLLILWNGFYHDFESPGDKIPNNYQYFGCYFSAREDIIVVRDKSLTFPKFNISIPINGFYRTKIEFIYINNYKLYYDREIKYIFGKLNSLIELEKEDSKMTLVLFDTNGRKVNFLKKHCPNT